MTSIGSAEWVLSKYQTLDQRLPVVHKESEFVLRILLTEFGVPDLLYPVSSLFNPKLNGSNDNIKGTGVVYNLAHSPDL